MYYLPDLTSLRISEKTDDQWDKWVNAITDGAGWGARPAFRTWRGVSARQKHRFYALINQSENDRFSAGQYNGPYTDDDIDVILRTKSWSIEHVLPRAAVNGRAPGEAEEDWLGWDVADSRANSTRSNLPLVLWPTPGMKAGRVRLEDDPQTHFNPIEAQKARLARKWLFLRATYSRIDVLDVPSVGQRRYADAIIANVRETKIGYAERRFQVLLEQYLSSSSGATWSNPLYGPRADEFLTEPGWTRHTPLMSSSDLIIEVGGAKGKPSSLPSHQCIDVQENLPNPYRWIQSKQLRDDPVEILEWLTSRGQEAQAAVEHYVASACSILEAGKSVRIQCKYGRHRSAAIAVRVAALFPTAVVDYKDRMAPRDCGTARLLTSSSSAPVVHRPSETSGPSGSAAAVVAPVASVTKGTKCARDAMPVSAPVCGTASGDGGDGADRVQDLYVQKSKQMELASLLLATRGRHGSHALIVRTPYALLVGCAYESFSEWGADAPGCYDAFFELGIMLAGKLRCGGSWTTASEFDVEACTEGLCGGELEDARRANGRVAVMQQFGDHTYKDPSRYATLRIAGVLPERVTTSARSGRLLYAPSGPSFVWRIRA